MQFLSGPPKLDLSGLATSTWHTIDFSDNDAYVGDAPDLSDATGILLGIYWTTSLVFNVKSTDQSTDPNGMSIYGYMQALIAVKLDGSSQAMIYFSGVTSTFNVLAKFGAEADFYPASGGTYNQTFFSTSSNSWLDLDLSSYVSTSAKYALIVHSCGYTVGQDVRHPDSSESQVEANSMGATTWFAPIKSSNRYTQYQVDFSQTDNILLIGEITSVPADPKTTYVQLTDETTGSWQTVDLDDDDTPPSGATAVICGCDSANLRYAAIRPYNDSSYTQLNVDKYAFSPTNIHPVDSGNRYDIYLEHAGTDFYVRGYLEFDSGAAGDLSVSVTDSMSIAESIDADMLLGGVNISDSMLLAESIGIEIPLAALISDSITIAESLGDKLPLSASVVDSITITELLTLLRDLLGSVSDSLTISEILSLDLPLPASVMDSLSILEVVTAEISALADLETSVADSITISEAVTALMNLSQTVVDSMTVADVITAGMEGGPLEKLLIDSISISESITALINILPEVTDSITISESITAYVPLGTSIVDSMGITETILSSMPLSIPVVQSITILESIQAILDSISTTVSDSITIADVITASLTSIAAELIGNRGLLLGVYR